MRRQMKISAVLAIWLALFFAFASHALAQTVTCANFVTPATERVIVRWPRVTSANVPLHDPSAPVGYVSAGLLVPVAVLTWYFVGAPAGSPVNVQLKFVPAGPVSGVQADAPDANGGDGGAKASYAISPSPPSALSSVTTACPPRGMFTTTAYWVLSES